jgi:Uma2 family endonuclease
MVKSDSKLNLPSSDQLPCSDDAPVDNENQNFIPNFLLFLLEFIWAERTDWFFAVDMGVYHNTGINHLVPVVPDGFLSLGTNRRKPGNVSRNSYVMWEENYIQPIFVLETVSQTPGGEYSSKMAIYANLGVLYYVIYNPEYWKRYKHQPFEVYKLVDEQYQLQRGEPFWMPEIGLGIGRATSWSGGLEREVLYWYDEQGNRYFTPEELTEQERLRAEQERLRAEQERLRANQERLRAENAEKQLATLLAKLKASGIDTETF